MKIALIFPRYKYPSGDPPLGIAYIAAVLRKNTKARIDVIDTTFDDSYKRAKILIAKNKYDIIGFSIMTTMLKDSLLLAGFAKKINPGSFVVFGGPHPTVMPGETIKNRDIDAVVIGEGEQTFLDLVKNIKNLKKVKGIWFKKNQEIIKNKPKEPIHDLDKLPYPAFDLLPIKKYMKHWFQLDSVARNLKGINIISSRGCPYNCTYCQPTLFKLFGRKIRKRSPKSIVEELKYWKKKLKINAFSFADDTFTFDKKWVKEICDRMISEKLNLRWGCNARANLVTEDLFMKMKKAGLRKVFMGIESGSQRVLDEVYNKRITIKQVRDAVKILKKLKLKIQGYFMIGAPTETEKEIKKTIKLAKELPIDEATFSVTTPLPETYLYNMRKKDIITDIRDFDYYKTCVYRSAGRLTPKKIEKLKKKALLDFYLSPKHIGETLKGFLTPAAVKKSLNKLKRF